MRAWFMIVAITLGLAGWWAGQDRTVENEAEAGTVTAMDDPGPTPTPRPR
jgi:hypothetical protein